MTERKNEADLGNNTRCVVGFNEAFDLSLNLYTMFFPLHRRELPTPPPLTSGRVKFSRHE
jgi:hypothetical protein